MLLEQFIKAGNKSSNADKYQFWQHDNHPIELWSNKIIDEKIDYVHNNPVEEGLVFSSTRHFFIRFTLKNNRTTKKLTGEQKDSAG